MKKSLMLVAGLLFSLGALAQMTESLTIQLSGPGGHSNGAYGRTNAVHAASHVIVEIEHLIPDRQKCIISDFKGGNSVNSIASNAQIKVTLIAKDQKEMNDLKKKVKKAVESGINKENSFRNVKQGDTVSGVPAHISFKIQ